MIQNVHERRLPIPSEAGGRLIDALASPTDELWPAEQWPAMRLDRPLSVGARGGHGPIRYHVEDYVPGQLVRFRFEAPAGFDGYHEYLILRTAEADTVLRHSLLMQTTGSARVSWPVLYRPLHDALIEDSLDKAGRSLRVGVPEPHGWSRRVRCLRALARGAQRRRSEPERSHTTEVTRVPAPCGLALPGSGCAGRIGMPMTLGGWCRLVGGAVRRLSCPGVLVGPSVCPVAQQHDAGARRLVLDEPQARDSGRVCEQSLAGSNQPSSPSMTPSTVMFSVTTSSRTPSSRLDPAHQ